MEDIQMTVFSINELTRLVYLIPETDPRTAGYATLLESIERLGAAIPDIDKILYYAAALEGVPMQPGATVAPASQEDPADNVVAFPGSAVTENTDEVQPVENEITPEANAVQPVVEEAQVVEADPVVEEAPAAEEPKYTLEQVREALGDYRIAHSGFKPGAFVREVAGVERFNLLPPEKFNLVMAKLKELE